MIYCTCKSSRHCFYQLVILILSSLLQKHPSQSKKVRRPQYYISYCCFISSHECIFGRKLNCPLSHRPKNTLGTLTLPMFFLLKPTFRCPLSVGNCISKECDSRVNYNELQLLQSIKDFILVELLLENVEILLYFAGLYKQPMFVCTIND